MADTQTSNPQYSDPLLNRFFLSPAEKSDKEKGKGIIKAFYQQQTNNDASLNYFKLRNSRWIELLLWCKGSQKMSEFLDYMNVSDGNKSYVNIDMTQTRLAAQLVGVVIESMGKNQTYPCVKAIDDGSMGEKEQRMFDALFRMHEAQTINDLSQQAGIHLEPPNAYVPNDELAAKVHFSLEDQLPKEIRFEQFLAKVKNDIKFERIMNRKTLFDLTVLNFAATKIERLAPKEYTVRKCIPTNMVYNFFMNDTGECEISQIGEFYNDKVKDFRRKYLKTEENPDGFSEKEIFELAKLSTNKNIGTFNYMWNDNWAQTTYNQNRPYDDCSILVFDCEIDCGEDVYYVEKTDAFGKMDITQKKGVPYQQVKKDGTKIDQPKPDNVTINKRKKNSWMRGIYAPYGDKMLYWGRPDLIITPYTDTANPLSSYSVHIPNNDGEYVPGLFERVMEPLREYQITKLKRKQLIAGIRRSGIRIDIESIRNIDLGNGDTIDFIEVMRIFDQTGNEVYSSKGVDPLQREAPPFSNTVMDNSIEKVIGLTNVLAGIVGEIRSLIGASVYMDGGEVGERTSGKLAEAQSDSSSNVTNFVLNGNSQLWEETFYKLCLLKWNDEVKEEPESKADMLNTRFDLTVKTKYTDYEKQMLEKDIERFSQIPDAQGNPLLSPKDALMLRQIDDYKLACYYLATTVEENRQKAKKDSQDLQQQNAQVQQQSAQQAAQQQLAIQQQELQAKMQMNQIELTGKKELEIITGLFAVMQKMPGGELPDTLKPLASAAISNVMMPLVQENKQMQGAMQQQQMQQAAAQQQQQQQAPEEQGEPQQQEQPGMQPQQ